MTIRPRLEEEKIAKLRMFYETKNQIFKNDSHMIEYLIDSFIAGNHIELLHESELLDNLVQEILDSNVKEFSSTIISDILNPLRDLAIHSTMILNLLADEVSVGMTENEKVLRLAEVKKEAIKVMAVDGSVQSFQSIENNE